MSRPIGQDLLEQIATGDNLFSLPSSLHQILEKLNDDNTPIDELAQVIQLDPSLSATALRVANSPYYHRVSEVRDLSQAVMTLGGLKVKTIALTATILDPANLREASGVNPVELISNSITVAAMSHKIALGIDYPRPEDALMVGLLHDLGILYLINSCSSEYAEIVRRCASGGHLLQAEREIFGLTHPEVGESLARRWKLPEEIVAGIGAHHGDREGASVGDVTLNRIVQLAVVVAGDPYINYQRDVRRDLIVVRDLASELGFDDAQLQVIASEASADATELAREFDFDIGSMNTLIMRANRKLGHYLSALERLFEEHEELSAQALIQERRRASAESRAKTVALLSHQINNAAMVILGRAEALSLTLPKLLDGDELTGIQGDLNEMFTAVDRIKHAFDSLSEAGELTPEELSTIESQLSAQKLQTPQTQLIPLTGSPVS